MTNFTFLFQNKCGGCLTAWETLNYQLVPLNTRGSADNTLLSIDLLEWRYTKS